MTAAKIAVTIDERLLREVDRWVAEGEFSSRSRAVQVALSRLLDDRTVHGSLLAELSKLDPQEERAMADEWLEGETPWPTS
jgi:Arc/MetJ-type ribon-helix-helix transcriptional regulator